jgi:hypothetical protein
VMILHATIIHQSPILMPLKPTSSSHRVPVEEASEALDQRMVSLQKIRMHLTLTLILILRLIKTLCLGTTCQDASGTSPSPSTTICSPQTLHGRD